MSFDRVKVDGASADVGEQSLANLLEQITGTLDKHGSVDVEELAREHPQHARRLRELMPTMIAMASWGHTPESNGNGATSVHGSSPMTGVLGDFRIVREIGRGGMGTVFEAEQISMGRRVALKVLPFAALAHDRALQRFRNEVRAAAALDHPHIVSVYSVGEERGIHYYSMQLIRGRTLAEMIGRLREQNDAGCSILDAGLSSATSNQRPASSIQEPAASNDTQPIAALSTLDTINPRERFRQIARLGIEAAEALQHAHDQGVLHRDIKPSNLMLDADGKVYVTDFGLARIGTDAGMTMTGDILGTLRYMAPEQALAKPMVVDHRADIYSLGATLYELVARRPAFGETDRSALLKQIAFDDPAPLRRLDHRIPAELETIVFKAMAKSRDERYSTAKLFADDLRAFLEHRPIRAKPTAVWQRANKLARRHPAAVWAAGAALLGMSIVLSLSQFRISRINRDLSLAKTQAERALSREAAHADAAIKAQTQSGDLLYAADVRLASVALTNKNVAEARDRLARNIPESGDQDRRHFEWYYLWNQLDQQDMTLSGHGPAFDVEYSPDGRLLASAHDSGHVVIRDAGTGKELNVLEPYASIPETARHVDFSPDSRFLASIDSAGRVNLWRRDDGKLLSSVLAHPNCDNGDLAFHPRDNLLATAAGATLKLFSYTEDPPALEELLAVEATGQTGWSETSVFALDISHDGRFAAVGGGGAHQPTNSGWVALWDLRSRKMKRIFYFRHQVRSLAFSHRRVVLACGTQSGEIAMRYISPGPSQENPPWSGHAGPVLDLAFSADDSVLTSASKDSTAGIWNVRQHEPLRLLQGHTDRVYGVAISPTTGQFATASLDGDIKLWSASVSRFSSRNLGEWINQARITPNGRYAILGVGNGTAKRYTTESGQRNLLPVVHLAGAPAIGMQANGGRFAFAGAPDVAPSHYSAESARRASVVAVDWDGDGDQDQVAAFGPTHQVVWRERLGPTRWATPRLGQERTVEAPAYLCDIDLDGDVERLWAIDGLLRSDMDPLVAVADVTQPLSLTSADLDSDGTAELVIAAQSNSTVTWYRRNGARDENAPRFNLRGRLTDELRRANSVAAADLNGDAKPDVVAGGYDGQVIYWKNLGDDRFADAAPLDVEFGGLCALEITDVDADGVPDVLGASANELLWYRNRGNDVFEPAQVVDSLEGANWLRPFLTNVLVYNTGNLVVVHRMAAPVDSFTQPALSPDAKQLAIADENFRIWVWRLPSEELICTMHTGGPRICDLAYSPDGRHLLAAVGNDLKIWDSADYRLLHTSMGHKSTIRRIAVSSDSKLVATVSDDMSARLWSLPDGVHRRALLGHPSRPNVVAFSTDSRRLATGTSDGTVRIWDLITGQELVVLSESVGTEVFRGGVLDLCFRDESTLFAITEDEESQNHLAEWHTK